MYAGLPPVADGRSCNPLVKIQHGDSKHFTSQKTKTTHPIWNQSFPCLYKRSKAAKLTLTVYDSNPFGRNTVIGDVEIVLSDGYRASRWFDIVPRKQWSVLDLGRKIVTEEKYGHLGQLFVAVTLLNVNQGPVYVDYDTSLTRSLLVSEGDSAIGVVRGEVTCFPEVDLDGEGCAYNSKSSCCLSSGSPHVETAIADEVGPASDDLTVAPAICIAGAAAAAALKSNQPVSCNPAAVVRNDLSLKISSRISKESSVELKFDNSYEVIEALSLLQISVGSSLLELETDEILVDEVLEEDEEVNKVDVLAAASRRQSTTFLPVTVGEARDDVVEEGSSATASADRPFVGSVAEMNERSWELVQRKIASATEGPSSASVKVAVRVRPLDSAAHSGSSSIVKVAHGTDIIVENERSGIVHHYAFDVCFDSENRSSSSEDDSGGQNHLFENLGVDVLCNTWTGYTSCLFAYGQTNSGKSYSMMGRPGNHTLARDATVLFFTQQSF